MLVLATADRFYACEERSTCSIKNDHLAQDEGKRGISGLAGSS